MLRKFSLPAKVTFLLSLVVVVVVFAVTLVINKISADSIANDLKERSAKAANEIAKELAENPQLPKTDDIEDTILNALEINRSITEISVFKMAEKEPEFAATSSRANQVPVTDEIRTSIQTGRTSAHLVPNEDERFWNIVVGSIIELRKQTSQSPAPLACSPLSNRPTESPRKIYRSR